MTTNDSFDDCETIPNILYDRSNENSQPHMQDDDAKYTYDDNENNIMNAIQKQQKDRQQYNALFSSKSNTNILMTSTTLATTTSFDDAYNDQVSTTSGSSNDENDDDDNNNCYDDSERNIHELSLHCDDQDKIDHTITTKTESIKSSFSFLDQLDFIFEKMCFTGTSTIIEDDNNTKFMNTATKNNDNNTFMDAIMKLLGCYTVPSDHELDRFSCFEMQLLFCIDQRCSVTAMESNTSCSSRFMNCHSIEIQQPQHRRRGKSMKRRILDQLLLERGRIQKQKLLLLPSTKGIAAVDINSSNVLRRTRSSSMVHDEIIGNYRERQIQHDTATKKSSYFTFDLWEQLFVIDSSDKNLHRSYNGILHDDHNTDGYDSDPELTSSSFHSLINQQQHRSMLPCSVIIDESTVESRRHENANNAKRNKFWYDTDLLRATVDEAMNRTWNLIWINNDTKKPIQIKAWIERGTILQNRFSTMVEPCLMWRCISSTATTKTGSMAMTTPESIRLLQICRVLPATPGQHQWMYKPSTSIVLRTIYHDTFIFQAPTVLERDSIIHAWKVVIARLATFAVLEDNKPLLQEFFLNKERIYQYS